MCCEMTSLTLQLKERISICMKLLKMEFALFECFSTFIARVVSKPLLLVILFETSFSIAKNVLFSVIIRLFMMFFMLQFMFIAY